MSRVPLDALTSARPLSFDVGFPGEAQDGLPRESENAEESRLAAPLARGFS